MEEVCAEFPCHHLEKKATNEMCFFLRGDLKCVFIQKEIPIPIGSMGRVYLPT